MEQGGASVSVNLTWRHLSLVDLGLVTRKFTAWSQDKLLSISTVLKDGDKMPWHTSQASLLFTICEAQRPRSILSVYFAKEASQLSDHIRDFGFRNLLPYSV